MSVVRPAQAADYMAVLAIMMEVQQHHCAVLPEVFVPPTPDLLPPEVFKARLGDPEQANLVADDGQVIGYAQFVHLRRSETVFVRPTCLVVEQIGVRADRWGCGHGRRLIEAGAVEAARRGLGRLELSVWAANAAAIGFYTRLGFTPITHRLARELAPSSVSEGAP